MTSLLPLPLKLYQEDGVMWMLNKERGGAVNGVHGGILGDDMGEFHLLTNKHFRSVASE